MQIQLTLLSRVARGVRDGDHAAALAHAEAGLAMWAGPTAPDLTVDAIAPADGHPRDEEVLAELLRCEAATAGPSAALARYDAYRGSIRDELGTDPGPQLREVHQHPLEAQTPASRHGVLHEPNPLLGRAADIAAVTELLRTSRVTSIVGTGGLGKTRLAHAVSRQVEHRVVHVVPLAGITSNADVLGEVTSVLGAADAWAPAARRTSAPLSSTRWGRARRSWCSTTANTSSMASPTWSTPWSPWPPTCVSSPRAVRH
ncbi:hypothetical protein GCM10009799_23730 [Nocardiopsis rhodophaea]|uniref:Bacterial transcriptional activator domain-containing protein n=1 Tax=Nocardiopsis rhodophaea TaxID=280238 RepID=A0ABN2T2K4_9ACTN